MSVGIAQRRAPDSADDRELLDRARSGDHDAFRTIVERHEPTVAATVRGMLGPGPDADDVGQETFIRFYKALDSFREESSIRTYLTRIAINLSLNALKRRKRQRSRFVAAGELGSFEPSHNGDGVIDATERTMLVRRAIDTLEPRYRAVVVLRMINGQTTKETAKILGVPQGTVLSRLSRGMKALEKKLGPYIFGTDDIGADQ